jgi:PAS domain S-box-containing protein
MPDGTRCAVLTDVTERVRRLEMQALVESEERFKAMADGTPLMIWVVDRDGRIQFVNRAYTEFFGVSLESVQKDGWGPLVHPDDREAYVAAMSLSLRERVPFRAQARVRRFDGEWRWVDSHGIPRFSASGEYLGFAGSSPDITDRIDLEARLRANAEELAEANRAKDDFLAVLSHELRTPLNAILGWAQMLTTGGLDRATAERGLEAIVRNAKAEAQLVHDILEVSRVVSGKTRLNVGAVDLVPVIYAALDSVRPAAVSKNIRLIPRIAAAATVINGDADRLQQVVWNLLSNAVKFTPEGGEVRLLLASSGGRFIISVRDTGIGIPAEFLGRVFDRFAQADTSSRRQYGGLGLGLAIVRQLVELHGGTVEAFSEGEGKGSEFVVRLPGPAETGRTEADAAVDTQPESDTQSGSSASGEAFSLAGLRVLVVDDEADARGLAEAVLGQAGAQVVLAGSVREALALLSRGRFDVMLADIGMPNEDGYELIDRVRRLPESAGGRVPAAALTAYGSRNDEARALASGFQLHLVKPVAPGELRAAVAVLAGRLTAG